MAAPREGGAPEGAIMAEVMYKRGENDERPWGRWEVLETGDAFCVKRISVRPGGCLSLQLHHHRSEHWIVVAGVARVTRGKEEFDLKANESVYIPVETVHRVANQSEELMEFIEVQQGDRLDENDIVRLEDSYGRG
jgi:mannose-6-phosphate isomerase-like protein (cupin superfamily)